MNIMQAIIDIEEKARGVAESAEALQENFEAELKKEIEDKRLMTENKIHDALEQYKLRNDAECKEEIEKLEKYYDSKLERLSDICKANKTAWVSEITQNIINS